MLFARRISWAYLLGCEERRHILVGYKALIIDTLGLEPLCLIASICKRSFSNLFDLERVRGKHHGTFSPSPLDCFLGSYVIVDVAILLLEFPCVLPNLDGAMSGALVLSERPRHWVLEQVVV